LVTRAPPLIFFAFFSVPLRRRFKPENRSLSLLIELFSTRIHRGASNCGGLKPTLQNSSWGRASRERRRDRSTVFRHPAEGFPAFDTSLDPSHDPRVDMKIYALGKNEGPAVWFLNQLVIIRAGGRQTANAFSLLEFVTPVGGGAPYHVHRADDETFYVLEGELEFISDERRTIGGPGTSVFLPRNIPHGFRVVGTSPARFLLFSAPAGFEEFVMEAGVPAASLTLPAPSPPDMAKLKSLAAKYHIETLGPLPA
jgi:quercetin dioxygenase-like cupin family protein